MSSNKKQKHRLKHLGVLRPDKKHRWLDWRVSDGVKSKVVTYNLKDKGEK